VSEKTLFVQARVVSTWDANFMIEYTIRSSAVNSKLARDTEGLLY